LHFCFPTVLTRISACHVADAAHARPTHATPELRGHAIFFS
jgi:hypothetical protein